MPVCSNFDCNNNTWGNKIRCSKCRFKKEYICSACPNTLTTNRQLLCPECVEDRNHIYHLEYQRSHKRINKESVSH